ncbi:MAG TPA: helix-turn-helix domain-containing protein, partial [Tissierellales bacterium]|nr:helix-turn-helix domain-containing protein [Tissierellales bacterium]
RVGETRERIVKPRIISALNIHPLDAIENHDIRMDLFYRLGVITIVIPPLKDRLDDIPILVDKFINKFNIKLNKNIKGVTPEVEEIFNSHNWPGNVRELEHLIEHSMIITTGDRYIRKENLPVFLIRSEINNKGDDILSIKNMANALENSDLTSLINNIEKQIIKVKIDETQGNVAAAARKLGISRQNLEYRTKKYNI